MSSARAASELRGPSTASTSDEEEEGACVCTASGGPHLLASCFILSSTLMWNWEEFPRPSTVTSRAPPPPPLAPCPCLAAVRHMTKDSVVPTLTKKPKLHASPWQLARPEMKNCWMRLLAWVRGWSVTGLYRSRGQRDPNQTSQPQSTQWLYLKRNKTVTFIPRPHQQALSAHQQPPYPCSRHYEKHLNIIHVRS